MNPEWLSEFWFTCTHSVVSGVSQLQGFIGNGTQPIIITAIAIRSILQLPTYESYESLPESDEAKRGLVDLTKIECKYSVDGSGNRKYSTIHKTKMDGVWNAIFTNFIQSLGTKSGSYDQFNSLEAQISWSLINSLRVDYASVIFNELITKVAEPTRAKYVPYPRFISLIFKNQFADYDRIPFQGFEPALVGSQIFAKPATAVLPGFMKHPGILAPQPVTSVHLSVAAPPLTTSLNTPPVTTVGPPPVKKPPTAPKKKSKLGSLTLKVRGHRTKKSTTVALGESVAVRSVTEGTLDKPSALTASLVSRKTSDSTKGNLKTAAVGFTTASSDSGASHTLRSSQPSHLSSSRKDDISSKGLVASAGANTPIADVTSLATDPSHLSSITAPTVNVSPPTHGEIQVATSISHEPSAKSQADDEEIMPMDTSDDTQPIPPPTTDSPIRELSPTSFSSDNIHIPPQQQQPPPAAPQHTSTHSISDQLLMEFIAASQTQIKMLTADREALIGNVSVLHKAVTALTDVYNSIEPWSTSVSEKVQTVADASAAINHAVAELASTSTTNFTNHATAIAQLTTNQNDLAISVSNYLFNTDAIVKVLPQMTNELGAIRAEVAALRKETTDGFDKADGQFAQTSQGESEEEDDVDISVSDPEMPPAMTDPLTNKAHREIVLTTYALRPIAEQPELEALAVAELHWVDMDVAMDMVDVAECFPEFSAEELRNYNELVQQWAVDEVARIEGTSVSYELARWEWMNREVVDDVSDDEEDDTIMHDADDDDNNDDGQGGGHGDGQDDSSDDDDENMEDQQPISSVIKRKRTSDTSPASTPPSKKQQVSDPHLQIVISEVAAPSSSPPTKIPSPTATTPTQTTKITTPTPATITSISTPTLSNTTSSDTSPTAYLSSDSTSESLCPEETNEQRIARKTKARQDREQEMILKINFEAELREEQERKRLLKEQSDADRAYLLQLSTEDANERARLLKLKQDQEESDAAIARVLAEAEESELEQQKLKVSASKSSKKKGGAVKTAVDRKWDEIDRKRFAARMTGRSNPAPITKVNLKKSKNQSQPQLLIYRGTETQAMLLDQVCKLHREEWNEIRLAISHSTSAAKADVLKEIDRLFQKMVSLQLLRPEDTVIHGEEIVQPPSPRYRSGTSSIYRIPNTSKLNLSIPADVPKLEGHEVTQGEKGLVYRDLNGALRFQREAELEKVDQEQLIHLIRSASMLPTSSKIRKAILDEALARKFRYLPSRDKYKLEAELGIVKEEEMWRDK